MEEFPPANPNHGQAHLHQIERNGRSWPRCRTPRVRPHRLRWNPGGPRRGEAPTNRLHAPRAGLYDYGAIEPVIDRKTMEIHHGKHHELRPQAQCRPRGHPLEGSRWNPSCPASDRTTRVYATAGISTTPCSGPSSLRLADPSAPEGDLAARIDTSFGLDALKSALSAAAGSRFGSGWAWLVRMCRSQTASLSVPQPTRTTRSCRASWTPTSRPAPPRHRRVGARVLPELPEPPRGLRQRRARPHQLVGGGGSGGMTRPPFGKGIPSSSSSYSPASFSTARNSLAVGLTNVAIAGFPHWSSAQVPSPSEWPWRPAPHRRLRIGPS